MPVRSQDVLKTHLTTSRPHPLGPMDSRTRGLTCVFSDLLRIYLPTFNPRS